MEKISSVQPKRRDRRFSTAASEAAKLTGERITRAHAEPMVVWDAGQDHISVWALKSGRYLTVRANRDRLAATVTSEAPAPAGGIWDKSEFYDICDAAGLPYNLTSAALEAERGAMA